MTRERLEATLPWAALAVLGASLTAWWIASRRIPDSADQAVAGLMARPILEGRGHPVFSWGSTYGGTLEPHLLAPLFALFGAAPAVLRAFYAVLWAAFAAGAATFTFRLFGRRAGLVAAVYLAVPPFFLPYKVLTSDGAYASVALLGLAVLWLACEADARLAEGRSAKALLAALGLATGLGLWVTPVTLPVAAAALLWLALRRGPRPAAAGFASCAAGALLGAAPTLVWNLRHAGGSLRARELAPAAGAGLLRNAEGFFGESLPVLLGAARPHFAADSPASFPGSYVVVPLVSIALLVPALLAARRDRRVVLLAGALAALTAAAILVARLAPREPRYMVAGYAAFVPLLALSVAGAARGVPRALAVGGFALLLASDLSGEARARRHTSDADDAQVTGPIGPLLSALREAGATRVFANYWTAYRVTFESGGSILATPIAREDGTRNVEWDAAVRAAENPAVVLLPPRDACFRDALRETGWPLHETRAGAFAVFRDLPPVVRDAVRAAGALPMPSAAYRVAWSDPSLPARLAPGGESSASIRAMNEGPCTWMANVRLAATWSGPARVEQAFPVPGRRVPSGDSAELDFTLRAPKEPGPWTLRLDLEQEGIARFSAKGGAPFEARIDVSR